MIRIWETPRIFCMGFQMPMSRLTWDLNRPKKVAQSLWTNSRFIDRTV
jgi:hypothetical protein